MNPFLTKGYISGEYFCDREEETGILLNAINNNRDIILYGRRRMGKSALIKHALALNQSKSIGVWIDLLPTQNLTDLIDKVATELLRSFNERSHLGKKLWKGITSLRPSISYDNITAQPSVSFISQSIPDQRNTLSQLIQLLSSVNKSIVIAFDEFQQIMNYPEKNVESFLRSLIQRIPNISVIYSGSDQTLLQHMFENINEAFYHSGQRLKLGPIQANEYVNFITNHFKSGKRNIDTKLVLNYIQWCNYRTLNIQILSNRLYATGKKKISSEDIYQVKNEILAELDDVYYMLRRIMTRIQWRTIQAIASETKVYEPYGKDFMKKHGFTNSSTIRRAIQKFEELGLFFHGADEQGDFLEIDDIFMKRWIENTIL